MALIAMCVYDTDTNNRTQYTERTLGSLMDTVDFNKHRLFIYDNASCEATKDLLGTFRRIYDRHDYPAGSLTIITGSENIGTAKGINECWKHRLPGENLIKMDNDVVIHQSNWVDLMEESINRLPDEIGIIGLKRKDCAEVPWRTDWAHSELHMLPHSPGERWLIVEKVNHVMGTCQMYNYRLIDKIGGLYQMDGLYGFDDSLAAARCTKAGYSNVFIHTIEIDHIDMAANDGGYQEWKNKYSGEMMKEYHKVRDEYMSGARDIYYPLPQ